ncbi:GILT-like protein 1 [Anoplophora glabripennis]|uniref:GILT-like protein 1 n=1 Tax=Anoplophora glabripennis TaxID=217634 RepID=UPI0008750B92|nr:GILT-like protein 1 [Anoplophora glabripennis]
MKVTHVLPLLLFFREVYLESKLNVEILFESLCPDSLRFIREQLHPHLKELAPYVNLKLVPFGKSASLEDGTQFICQHGPQECKGNRIMSCALERISDQTLQVDYVNCFMTIFKRGKHNPEEFGQLCAMQSGLDINDVMKCYNTNEGTIHQLRAEDDTVRILPKFIPTVLYNGEFVQQLQDESLLDFKGVVCRLISKNFPGSCLY